MRLAGHFNEVLTLGLHRQEEEREEGKIMIFGTSKSRVHIPGKNHVKKGSVY
jgi:hypothetical protein